MPSLAEIWRALHGAWRLAFLDTRGLADFDGSRSGGLRSFWAIALVLPLTVASIAIKQFFPGSEPAAPHNDLVELAGSLVAWLVLMAVMYGLVVWYGRVERFWLFVASYNWTQVPLTAVILLSVALFAGTSALVDPNADAETTPILASSVAHIAFGIAFTLQLGTLVYEWYVAWAALDSGVPLPIIVVLLDVVMGLGLSHISTAFA
ncbi:MAG TPA: hypothetical protein VKB68_13075 [Stellaceae bacterium]|nr:hypothetical protein [Stellaceae bacterium]